MICDAKAALVRPGSFTCSVWGFGTGVTTRGTRRGVELGFLVGEERGKSEGWSGGRIEEGGRGRE